MSYPAGAGEPLLTVEQFSELPEEDEFRIELVRGGMVREPRPGAEHSTLVGSLFARLHAHVRAQGLGIALVDTGFRIPGRPATVRGPDVAFIAEDRLPPVAPKGFWELAPDLAVEVVSPTDRWTAVQEKVVEYLDVGTREVWVVDPAARQVTVYRPAGESFLLREDDALDGGVVVPEFSLPLAELFGATSLR